MSILSDPSPPEAYKKFYSNILAQMLSNLLYYRKLLKLMLGI